MRIDPTVGIKLKKNVSTAHTGDRPTGKLHLGHYLGSLQGRLQLQESYESFILIADYHMLTTKPSKEDITNISTNVHEIMLDYVSVGLSPDLITFYLQSQVPEVTEITLLLSMLTTVPRLQRLPSLKDMAKGANCFSRMGSRKLLIAVLNFSFTS
jgi:tryptophanyl-tRNA synthetase